MTNIFPPWLLIFYGIITIMWGIAGVGAFIVLVHEIITWNN